MFKLVVPKKEKTLYNIYDRIIEWRSLLKLNNGG